MLGNDTVCGKVMMAVQGPYFWVRMMNLQLTICVI